jgi:hypothetical protein
VQSHHINAPDFGALSFLPLVSFLSSPALPVREQEKEKAPVAGTFPAAYSLISIFLYAQTFL